MSDSPLTQIPTVIRSGDEIALAVLVQDRRVTAVTVRRQPIRVTGFYRASKEGSEAWNIPALATTLRRKLRVDADVRTVVVVEPTRPESDDQPSCDVGCGDVASSLLSRFSRDRANEAPRALIPPDLANKLDLDSDLRAIAVAVAQLE